MADSSKNKKRKKVQAKYIFRRAIALLCFALVLAGIVLSLTVFFNISAVEVQGRLEIYTRAEIIEASGIKVGNNLFRFSSASVRGKIIKTLPYVYEADVTRVLPNKVVITIKEADNAFILPYNGEVFVLSQDLDIIKSVSYYEGKALTVSGIEPVETAAGKKLQDKDEDKVKNLKDIIDALAQNGVLSGVTAIDVSDKLDLKLTYEDRIQVKLGTHGDLDRKIMMLKELVTNKIGPSQYGDLDLTVVAKATFAPVKDAAPVEEETESEENEVAEGTEPDVSQDDDDISQEP